MAIKLQSPRKATDTEFILPIPISSNRYWRSRVMMVRGKPIVSTYVSPEAKQFKAAVKRSMAGVFPLSGDVVVHIDIYRARKVGDLDNKIKCLLDSLNGILWHDDKQIVGIIARRFDDKVNPRAVVKILLENYETQAKS